MNGEVQQPNPEGEVKEQVAAPEAAAVEQPAPEQPAPAEATENPAVENTETAQQEKAAEDAAKEPAREMTAEQFDLYNETLRRVSKTAKAKLPDRYNAFEDTEVKTLVKQKVMAGETPSVKELAESVVARMTKKAEPTEPKPNPEQKAATDTAAELIELKAENALLKAGITTERLDAAKKLFIAEGAHFDKIDEFVAKYPEWHAQEGRGVVLSKAQPLSGKTAPNPGGQPVLNDYEAKVQALRKARGYNT